jgi:hypothetical protein
MTPEQIMVEIIRHIEVEQAKYSLWSFVNQYSENRYYDGCYHALEDLKNKIKGDLKKLSPQQIEMQFESA